MASGSYGKTTSAKRIKKCQGDKSKRQDVKLSFGGVRIHHETNVKPLDELQMLTSCQMTIVCDDESSVPQFKITKFWVTDENDEIVAFNDGLIEDGYQLFLSGYVKDITSDNSNDIKDAIAVTKMGPLTEWWFSGFDGSDGIILGLETCYASYILLQPHDLYTSAIQSMTDQLLLVKIIIEYLTINPCSTYDELIGEICERSFGKLDHESILKFADFIIHQIVNYDQAGSEDDIKIMESRAMGHLLDLSGNKSTTFKPRKNKKTARRDRRCLNNSDNLTVTTKLVGRLFGQYFDQVFESSSRTKSSKSTKSSKCIKNNRSKSSWVSDLVTFDEVTSRKFYSAVELDGKVLKIGDFVSLTPKPQSDNNLDTFGQIKWMFEDSRTRRKYVHVSILISGSKTILGKSSDSEQIFAINKCSDFELSSIVSKIIVIAKKGIIKSMTDDHMPSYICNKMYDQESGWFRDLPKDHFEVTNSCPCQVIEQDEVKVSSDNLGCIKNGSNYQIGDFVLVEPSAYDVIDHFEEAMKPKDVIEEVEYDKNIFPEKFRKNLSSPKGTFVDCIRKYHVGQIVEFCSKNGNVHFKVRKFLRPENIFRTFQEIVQHDMRELFWTDKFEIVDHSLIVSKVQVVQGIKNDLEFDFFVSRSFFQDLPSDEIDSQEMSISKHSKVDDSDVSKLIGLDLFSGCGGLALGFQEVVETKWAIERDGDACESFASNFPNATVLNCDANHILEQIISGSKSYQDKELPAIGSVDIILAGPPCQGFSKMNRFSNSTYSLFKNSLIAVTLSYVDVLRPKYVIIENVRNFFKFNKNAIFKITLSTLLSLDYQVSFCVLNSGTFGLSQTRNRAFIIAAVPGFILPDLPRLITSFPLSQVTSSIMIDNKKFTFNIPMAAMYRQITVHDAISDLPPISTSDRFEDKDQPNFYNHEPRSWFQKMARRSESQLITDHICRPMSILNRARFDKISFSSGADWRNLPNIEILLSDGTKTNKLSYNHVDQHGNPSLCICSNGKDNCPSNDNLSRQENTLIPWCLAHTASRNNQWCGLFGRISWNEYFSTCVTIPEPMSKQGRILHPEQNRVLSVRECARCQGFPDNFIFCGKSINSKYRQIGNAVPPPLAAALAKQLKIAITKQGSNVK